MRNVLREYLPPDVNVWVFGSRANWTAMDSSDLDLALEGDSKLGRKTMVALEDAFEDSSLPYTVDVIDLNGISDSFRRIVVAQRVPFPVAHDSGGARTDWLSVPVSYVTTAIIGGTPSRSMKEYWHGEIPWTAAKDVAAVSGRYLDRCQEFITEQGLESSAAKLMPKGTVIITARGTVGALAQLGRDMAFNQTCYALLPMDGLNQDFLFYALKGTLSHMQALTYGTVFDTITRVTFDSWYIPLPPLPEQRAIAHVLGTLDDKIELNRRMNVTLEEMARALFKSWFVDFEPVRAKMAGRWNLGESLPGLPTHLYDLFPDRLMDSELGKIPEGWKVKTLERFAELNPREPMKKRTPAPYLNMTALPTSDSSPDNAVLREFASGTRFRNGDTLLARITPCLENGKTAFVQSLPKDTVGWGSTEFIVMRAIPPVPPEYTYLLARDPRFRAHAIQSMTGTSGRQRARTEVLARYLFSYPDTAIWFAFGSIVGQMFGRIKLNNEETHILSAQRDILLPKLMLGKVQISSLKRAA